MMCDRCSRDGKLVSQGVIYVDGKPFVFRCYLCSHHMASENRKNRAFNRRAGRKVFKDNVPVEKIEDKVLLDEYEARKEVRG